MGVGVNLNQEQFLRLPNAVSLKQVLKQPFNIEFVLEEFCYYMKKVHAFKSGHFEKIDADYHNVLYI